MANMLGKKKRWHWPLSSWGNLILIFFNLITSFVIKGHFLQADVKDKETMNAKMCK